MNNTYNSIDNVLNTSFVRANDEVVTEKKKVSDVVSIQKDYSVVVTKTKKEIDENFSEDYDFIRETLKDLMNHGKEALDTSLSLARDTESPRCFEVCTTIMNTMMTLGKELTNLHKEALKISGDNVSPTTIPSGATITQNNYYPTPKELQSILDDVTEVIYDDKDLI